MLNLYNSLLTLTKFYGISQSTEQKPPRPKRHRKYAGLAAVVSEKGAFVGAPPPTHPLYWF